MTEPSQDELGDYEADKKASRAFAKHKATPEEVASTSIIPQEELDKTIEESLVNAFKLGMLDALGDKNKPNPMPALKEQGANIKSALNSLTLKQVLSLIDRMSDTPMPRVGKSDKYVRSPQSFQDGYAEARAELRQSAERIWKI